MFGTRNMMKIVLKQKLTCTCNTSSRKFDIFATDGQTDSKVELVGLGWENMQIIER